MKWLILAAALLVPAAASAQGSQVAPFATEHKWMVTTPGVLTLGGTAFTVAADRTRSGEFSLTYTLFWKKQRLLTSDKLNDCEMLGVSKAVDLQTAGASLE